MLQLSIGALVCCASFAQTPLRPGELRLSIVADDAVALGANLVPNAGFEAVEGNQPEGWAFAPRNTDATFEVVPDGRHGGQAVLITNSTPHGAHVYGQLTLTGGIALEPGETYTLSCYVKSDGPGRSWIGGGDGWWMRLNFTSTGGEWKRFVKTFGARDGDKAFAVMVNTDSPTDGFLIDDIKLEKGATPTPAIQGDRDTRVPEIDLDVPDPLMSVEPTVTLPIWLYLPGDAAGCEITCVITGADGVALGSTKLTTDLAKGVTPIEMEWDISETPNVVGEIEVTIVAAGETATSKGNTTLLTMAGFSEVYSSVLPAVEALTRAVAEAKDAGAQAAYPVAALQVAERFGSIVEEIAQAGGIDRASQYAADIVAMCEQATEEARGIAAGRVEDRTVADHPMDQVEIVGRNFVVGDQPVSLVGPLGYGELLNEIETVRNYGFNVVGDDFNSYSALRMVTGDDTFDETAIPKLLESWDRLRDLNLAISYNPTPHYFPEWALTKYPDITGGDPVDRLPDWSGLNRHAGSRTKSYGGFFPFAIESPTVHRLIERYYGKLFPAIKDHPSTRVTWLMNEPTYGSSDAEYLRQYREFLREKYDTLAELNETWGTEHESLDKIGRSGPVNPGRFDFMDYHNQHVAEWFEWLADEVRKNDPNAIVSNKPMAWTILQPERGIDFERQAEIMDVPGCDASRAPRTEGYAYGWMGPVFLFDFYASVAPNKPQADLEYHYVHQPYATADYVRSTYWQSYLHGLRLSTFWVWGKGQLGDGKAGAGMTHTAWSQPQVGWGTATSALDVRRLAKEISHFPPPAEVALYFSKPSLYLDEGPAQTALQKAYAGLFFSDAPVGFVTDKMIREGKLNGLKTLVVPGAKHVERDVLEQIVAFAKAGGHVVLLGDCLREDEHRGPHLETLAVRGPSVSEMNVAEPSVLHGEFESVLEQAGVGRPVRAGQWAVECRSVRTDDGVLCSLLNLNEEAVEVDVTLDGEDLGDWEDLITAKSGTGPRMSLEPMVPLFIRIR